MIFRLDRVKNEIYFQFSSIKLFFLFRIINEIVGFINKVNLKNAETALDIKDYIKQTLNIPRLNYQKYESKVE